MLIAPTETPVFSLGNYRDMETLWRRGPRCVSVPDRRWISFRIFRNRRRISDRSGNHAGKRNGRHQCGRLIADFGLRLIPDTMKAFSEISRAAQKPGTLERKTKELMALAIAVSGQCDACIAYHARGAGKAGASRQEVAETLAVAIQMGGGPAVNYATDALRAFDELAPLRPARLSQSAACELRQVNSGE